MSQKQSDPKLEPKLDLRKLDEREKAEEKTKQKILMVVWGRGGESPQYCQRYNMDTMQIVDVDEEKTRVFGIGFNSFCGLVNMTNMFNRKSEVREFVRMQERSRLTGKMIGKWQNKGTGRFVWGWQAIQQHLNRFCAITLDELLKMVEPYKNNPRIIFWTKYGAFGVSIHGQPEHLEKFMGFENSWVCSSGMPNITESRFAWLNKRVKKLAEKNGLDEFWQVRIPPKARRMIR